MLEGYTYCRMLFKGKKPVDFIYLEVNKKFEDQTGLKSITGKKVSEVIPGILESNPEIIAACGRVAKTGISEKFETYLPDLDMWFLISVYSPKSEHFVAVFDDTTERKKAEEVIKLSEEKYRRLIENSHDIIYTLNQEGIFTFVSQSMTYMLGYNSDQLIGKPFQKLIHKDDIPQCLVFLKKTIETGERQTGLEYRAQHADGTWRWHVTNAMPIKDKSGAVLEFEGTSRDITESRETEALLRIERERMGNILEGTNAGTWEWNVQTGETVFNERWAQIIGYTLKELSPLNIETWQKYAHPEDREKAEITLNKVFNRELDYYSVEARIRHKNGSWVWVQDRGKVLSWTTEGKPLWMSGIHSDISDRKNIEEALLKTRELALNSEARLKKAQSVAHIGDFTWDIKNHSIVQSDEMYKIFGINKNSYDGSLEDIVAQIIHPDDLSKLTPSRETIKKKPVEFRVIWPDKSIRHIWAEIGDIVTDEEGEPVYLSGTCQDITERKKAEQELRESEERYRMLSEQSPITIERYDKNGVLLDVNPACLILFGLKDDREIRNFNLFADPNISDENKKRLNRGETVRYQEIFDFEKVKELKLYKTIKSGTIWVDVIISPYNNNNKVLDGYLVYVTDITESKMAEAEILHISYHDKLTDLYNRRFFEEEIKRLDTERQLPISFIMGDLNGLKLINDVFGHIEGDKLLKEAAKILKKVCRADDILARWGGDEFVLLLPRTSIESAEDIVQRIKKACKKTSSQKIPLNLSIGVSSKTEIKQDMQSILIDAESYMYKNKLVEKESLTSSIVFALDQTLYEKSNETKEHTDRIHDLAIKLGKSIKLSSNQLDSLSLLASLHDIGKVAIPEKILLKKGELTEKEWLIMKRHPEIGCNIAQASPQIAHIAKSILACHENWDGSGYPLGLAGPLIPVNSRIVFIVDAYDVMTGGRIYKKSMSKKAAIKELKRCAGSQFDPELVDKLIEILTKRPLI